jgi:hypothetical protein
MSSLCRLIREEVERLTSPKIPKMEVRSIAVSIMEMNMMKSVLCC